MSTLDRRSFIGRALTVSGVSGLSATSNLFAAEQLLARKPAQLLAVYREGSADSRQFATQLQQAGIQTLSLQEDIVQQWRNGLGLELSANKKLLLGMGNWADFTLLQGLAAEIRQFPILSIQHALHGQSVPDWASKHAEELLALTQLQNSSALEQVLQQLSKRSDRQGTAPSVFSWLIG